MISIIIASYNEKDSIGKAIKRLSDREYTGIPNKYEIIQVTPDDETLNAGLQTARELHIENIFTQIKDPRKGKAHALNMALDKAQGEIIVMSDGDVYFDKNSLNALLECFDNKKIGGVCGRPIPVNTKENFWGYLSHLLTSAADHKRRNVFNTSEKNYYTKNDTFFPLSGYILAFKNLGIRYDSRYIDDTYISLQILENGYQLAYAPNAKVYVKFPTSLKDYLVQRRRNFKGNDEILKDKRFSKWDNPRSFLDEIKYVLFPLRYASNHIELVWSILFYPIRLLTWIYSLLPEKKTKTKVWKEIQSTK